MVNTNKLLLRAVLVLSYVFIISIGIFLISSLYGYFNTGADRSKMLHLEIKKAAQYTPKIIWKEDGNNGRIINNQTLKNIENDYLNAWYVKLLAFKNNTTIGIEDYYTASARINLFNFIKENKKNQISINATTLKHHLDILFFSEDGQLVVLQDSNVLEYKQIFKENKIVLETKEETTYKIILLLEDGFWRVRHIVKEKSKEFHKKLDSKTLNTKGIKGINYYPQNSPWNLFGENFDKDIIDKDFKIIKEAQLNSIRIFIPFKAFGKAKVNTEKLEKLGILLDIAQINNLKVVVTLFDFYGNYDVLDWTLTQRHAETIVLKFKNHPAILAWDLKNEPNLDFNSRGKKTVIAWLENMLFYIKSIDTLHPVTIGWSNAESATILSNKVDFISFHYYDKVSDFEKTYQSLKNKIKHKPIVLQEFGVSSYDGFWKPIGNSQEKQANYYQEMQKALTKNNIHFMSWTLYDFDKIPNNVVGSIPWRKNPQKEFGFIDVKGNKKPSFKYISK